MDMIDKFIQSKIIGQHQNEITNPYWERFPMSVGFHRTLIQQAMNAKGEDIIIKCSSVGMAYIKAIERTLDFDGNIWIRGYKFIVDAEINFDDQERYIFRYRDEELEPWEWDDEWLKFDEMCGSGPSFMDMIDNSEPTQIDPLPQHEDGRIDVMGLFERNKRLINIEFKSDPEEWVVGDRFVNDE